MNTKTEAERLAAIPKWEQIIQMGLETLDRMAPDHHCREPYWTATDDELERFAALVAAAERKRLAAKIAQMPFGDTAASFAVWIRNGGEG